MTLKRWQILGILLLAGIACALVLLGRGQNDLVLPDGSSAQGRVVITYWEKWTRHEYDAIRAVVDKFNMGQREVFVQLLSISQIQNKTLLAVAGGDPPDLAGLYADQVPQFYEYGALESLGDLQAEGVLTKDTYKPFAWRIMAPQQVPYAIVTTPAVIGLFWNKDRFAQAGLDPEIPPHTLEELQTFSDRMTERDAQGNLIRVGFLPNEPGWYDSMWGAYFGNQLYDAKTGRFGINTPENRAAYTWYQNYAKHYGAQEVQTFSGGFGQFATPDNPFFTGKTAMVIQGPWFPTFIARFKPELVGHYGVAAFPTSYGKPGDAVLGDADVLVIPHGARHPREARQFIRFMIQPENMEALCRAQGKPSPLSYVSNDFLSNNPNPFVRFFDELGRKPGMHIMAPTATAVAVREEMKQASQSMWRGADVGKTLSQVQTRVDRLVAEHNLRQAQRKAGGQP
jgi:multiple sugar transport system substrate-binding protein